MQFVNGAKLVNRKWYSRQNRSPDIVFRISKPGFFLQSQNRIIRDGPETAIVILSSSKFGWNERLRRSRTRESSGNPQLTEVSRLQLPPKLRTTVNGHAEHFSASQARVNDPPII